jgi:hypothetical protein
VVAAEGEGTMRLGFKAHPLLSLFDEHQVKEVALQPDVIIPLINQFTQMGANRGRRV